jgi:hypothetical protein
MDFSPDRIPLDAIQIWALFASRRLRQMGLGKRTDIFRCVFQMAKNLAFSVHCEICTWKDDCSFCEIYGHLTATTPAVKLNDDGFCYCFYQGAGKRQKIIDGQETSYHFE